MRSSCFRASCRRTARPCSSPDEATAPSRKLLERTGVASVTALEVDAVQHRQNVEAPEGLVRAEAYITPDGAKFMRPNRVNLMRRAS